jgi:hypothetical protein
MLQNLLRLEHKISDRVYHFVCDPNSPIQECKTALLQFMGYLTQLEEQQKAQQTQASNAQTASDVSSKSESQLEEPKTE